MSTTYEVWNKAKWGLGTSKPEEVYYLVDSAYDAVKRLSKNKSHTSKLYKWNPNKSWDQQGYEEVEIPDVYLVVERSKLTTLRGVGVSGKLIYPKNCLRCSGTGTDVNNWQEICRACDGGGLILK